MPGSDVDKVRSVLISGASIAGPTLAYWLERYGFDVTVVERAPSVRGGGYPIDVRGVALEVLQRMDLLPQVREAHVASRTMTFVDRLGKEIGQVPIYDFEGSGADDVELPRGTLTGLLYGLTQHSKTKYHFGDSIEAFAEDETGVRVHFKSGEEKWFDAVLGADGLHSNTRWLMFGEEKPFNRFLGQTFNLFSVDNVDGLSQGITLYAEPGRSAGLYAVGKNPEKLFAFLTFASEAPPFRGHRDPSEQIEQTAKVFSECGWEVPRLLQEMRRADDLYFDTVSQIKVPIWSKGRLALVGDAAFAPSFRSGQGTSLALVGAYVLAGELAAHERPSDAFDAYERRIRGFVEANQDLALKERGDFLLPRTQAQLEERNRVIVEMSAGVKATDGDPNAADHARKVHNSLNLPDYGHLLQ